MKKNNMIKKLSLAILPIPFAFFIAEAQAGLSQSAAINNCKQWASEYYSMGDPLFINFQNHCKDHCAHKPETKQFCKAPPPPPRPKC